MRGEPPHISSSLLLIITVRPYYITHAQFKKRQNHKNCQFAHLLKTQKHQNAQNGKVKNNKNVSKNDEKRGGQFRP